MKKSYYSEELMKSKLEKLREEPDHPEWLEVALKRMKKIARAVQPEEDEKRYIVEYIYPH